MVKTIYQPVFRLSGPYSREQLNGLFADLYEGEPDAQRKATSFLLSAMQEANIPIVGGDFGVRGRPAAFKGKVEAATRGKPRKSTNFVGSQTSLDILMRDIYDPESMAAGSDEERAVFTLIRFFKARM